MPVIFFYFFAARFTDHLFRNTLHHLVHTLCFFSG